VKTKSLFFALLMFATTRVLVAQEPSLIAKQQQLDAQWNVFLSHWEGSYDNNRQVQEQIERGVHADSRNRHTTLVIKKIELPAFGDHVFYGEWQAYGKPNKVTRQRIYNFVRENDSTFRMNLHIFPMDSIFKAKTSGAHLHPEKLKSISPKDMYPLAGCDVFFKPGQNHFQGAMKKGDCSFEAPNTGTPIYSWSQMKLTGDTFEYLDGWFNLDGSIYYEISKEWYIFDKL